MLAFKRQIEAKFKFLNEIVLLSASILLLSIGCASDSPRYETFDQMVSTCVTYSNVLEFHVPGDVRAWQDTEIRLVATDLVLKTATFEWTAGTFDQNEENDSVIYKGVEGGYLINQSDGKRILSDVERVDGDRVILRLYWGEILHGDRLPKELR